MTLASTPESRRRWAQRLLVILAAYQLLLGAYFMAVRPTLLPEDLRYMQLQAMPGTALPWLDLVFTVAGGQMMATGLLLVPYLDRLRSGEPFTRLSWICLLGAAVSSAGLMSGVNFLLESDFRWVLTTPIVIWGFALTLTWPPRKRD